MLDFNLENIKVLNFTTFMKENFHQMPSVTAFNSNTITVDENQNFLVNEESQSSMTATLNTFNIQNNLGIKNLKHLFLNYFYS